MPSTLHDFTVRANDGSEVALAAYRGRVLLVVNTASRCGFTPQYAALETLHRRYAPRGFAVLGFPCNDFLRQDPGSDAEILAFCSTRYDVSFPLFAKVRVRGTGAEPLYAWLTRESACPGAIGWNFAKFLAGPDGEIAARFEPATDPLDPRVTAAIETLLPAA